MLQWANIALWLACAASLVRGAGYMLLYRPRDATAPCAYSRYLRYDISFGMGMSDTITLVFRTMYHLDYECVVEIVADSDDAFLLIVVRYPNSMALNCQINSDAISVLKKARCLRLCDFVHDQYSNHAAFSVRSRLRFRFISNSSINAEMSAYVYQVTATAARAMPAGGCFRRNESVCSVNGQSFCFTSGVVCDGIRNCGVNDWFDERMSLCALPIARLGYGPVVAVAAALLCALVAASHLLLRCLPPQANSFFIFNANEDNRLCIDPLMLPRCQPEHAEERRSSLPAYDSSSSESDAHCKSTADPLTMPRQSRAADQTKESEIPANRRKMTMRSVTTMIQDAFRYVTGNRSVSAPGLPLESLERQTTPI